MDSTSTTSSSTAALYKRQQEILEEQSQHNEWLLCSKCYNGIFEYKDLYLYIDVTGVYLELYRDYYSYDPYQLPKLGDRWDLVLKSKSADLIYQFDASRQDFSIHKPYMMCTNNECNQIIGRYYQDTIDNQKSTIFSYRLDHTTTFLSTQPSHQNHQPWKTLINTTNRSQQINLKVYKFMDKDYFGFNTINYKYYSPTSPSFIQPINIEEQKQHAKQFTSITTTANTSTNTTTPGGEYDEFTPGEHGYFQDEDDEILKSTLVSSAENANSKQQYKPTIYSESKPMIPEFKQGSGVVPREYQIESYYQSTQRNTLLVLPTGMGKTLVSIMTLLEMYRLNNQDNPEEGDTKRVALFLVDRVPLVTQQSMAIENLTDLKVLKLYGEMNSRSKFQRIAIRSKKYDVLVATVQCVVNLLEIGCLNINDFYFITFDEVHHATGNHAYNTIINYIRQSEYQLWPRLLGLTASLISPGGNLTHINEQCQNQITKLENDMLSMVFKPSELLLNSNTNEPQLIEFTLTSQEQYFDKVMTKFLIEESKSISLILDYSDIDLESIRNNEFLRALVRLSKRSLEKEENVLYMDCRNLIRLYHVLSVLSIEGPTTALQILNDFIEDLYKHDSGESEFLIKLIALKFEISEFNESLTQLERLSTRYKVLLKTLKSIINETENQDSSSSEPLRILIFVETRIGATNLTKMLKKESFDDQLHIRKLVGHNGVDGMSSEKQQKIIKKFENGHCKLIVSTNVIEEGLDIQSCNLVICYDGILSLKSLIQRRGRARSDNSKFIIIYNDKNDLKILKVLGSENLLNNSINSLIQKRKDQELINNNFLNWKKVYTIIDDIKREQLENEEYGIHKKYIMLSVYHINNVNSFKQFLDSYDFNGMEYFVGHVEIVAMKIDDEDQYLSNFIIVTLVGSKSEEISIIKQFIQLLISNKFTFWLMNKSFYLTSATSVDAIETFPNLLIEDELDQVIASTIDDIPLSIQQDNLAKNENSKVVFQIKSFEYGNMESPTLYYKVDSFEGGFELEFQGRQIYLTQQNRWRMILRFQDVEISYLYQQHHNNHEELDTIDLIFFVKRPLRFEESKMVSQDKLYWYKSPPPYKKLKTFGKSFTYRFIINNDKSSGGGRINELLKLFQVYGFKLFNCNIDMIVDNDGKQGKKKTCELDFSHYFIKHHNKDVNYLLHCIDSQRSFGRIITQQFIDMIAQLLSEGKVEESKFIILSLISGKTKFLDYKKFIVDTLCYFNKDSYLEKRNKLSVTSGEFTWIREIIITPSRTIYIEPRLQRSNRAIRKFGTDNFIMVKFTDEEKNPMQGINKNHPVFSIIRSIFLNGIKVEGDGEVYSYVGNSNSQLRDYSAWLVSSKIGSRLVRQWTEISHVENARKFFRCVGLMFSTTLPTVRIFKEHYHNLADIEREHDNHRHNFTEGCGEIGKELSRHLNETYGFQSSTCAYQIRIGGSKGMLVVNDQLEDPMGVYIRPSMIKFETKDSDEHRTLEICSVSTTSRCKLNRQVISLLSTLGTKDSVFFSLQDRYLNQLANIVNDVNTSRQLISEFFPDITESELYQDTYIRRILITLYKLKMERIQQKCSIEIKDSRNLLGVSDTTGLLPPNTVFVQIEEEDPIDGHKYQVVITGLVMVIKNPCTHPGDVRYLNAVDIPSLHHLRNVLVFSTQGEVPNFKEISGSDLDGDRYFFCYDKSLIGSRESSYKAYLGDESNIIRSDAGNVFKNSTLLVDMYFINVERQQLGTMYNAHLAICDSIGATHDLAIKVSKECFKEIDFAKTGVHGQIPKTVLDLLREKGYPHFMRKELSTRDYYPSRSVMGLMYDQIDQLVYIGDFLPDIVADESNLVPGFQSYVEDAYILYREYKLQVHSLLQRYGSESEESLMIGFFDHSSVEEKVSKDVKNEMKSNYKKIQQMFENEFLKDFGEEQREITLLKYYDRIEKKIAAWYFVSYNDKDPNKTLGFFWIARSFKKLAMQDDHRKKRNIMVNSILNHMEVKRIEILPLYKERLEIGIRITNYLKTLTSSIFADSSLELTGSSATLLFEKDSDISFYLNIKDLNGLILTYHQRLEIINLLKDELKSSPLELKKLEIKLAKSSNLNLISKSLPILKFSMSGYFISINLDELHWQETIVQQSYIDKDPFILSLLFSIVDWGIKSSFIPSSSNLDTNTSPISTKISKDKNLTKSNLFSLFIQFSVDNKLIEKIDEVKLFKQFKINFRKYGPASQVSSNKTIDWWDSIFEVASRYFFIERTKQQQQQFRNGVFYPPGGVDDSIYYNTTGLGDTLLSFFKYYSDKFGQFIYDSKTFYLLSLVKGNFNTSIDPNLEENKSTLLFYQESFRHALHSLSTFISIDDFLSNCFKSKKKTMFIKKNQLDKLRQEKERIIHRVKLCGCKISIANINLDKGIIEIEGIPQHLRMAQNEIRDLLANGMKDLLSTTITTNLDNTNNTQVNTDVIGGYRNNNFLSIKSDYKNNKSHQ